jgi:hypothetical protein
MTTDDDLLSAMAELRTLFPDWRLGQLVANLLTAAGQDGRLWDVADDQLLAAARRLVERNQARAAVPA